ncbi:MAG: hydrogenase expression/formation protein HypE [Anaerolineales bacterium]
MMVDKQPTDGVDPAAAEGMQGAVCPVPLQHEDQVVLGHGSGGKLTQKLIARYFYPPFENPYLLQGDDSAVMDWPQGGRLAFSTDSHIVSPLFFPGGDIGRLAVAGTVNDLLMVGAQPLWLTAGFLLEEGLPLSVVERVAASMRAAADEAGVQIVAGDTKVVQRGKADGLFVNTSGVGMVPEGREINGRRAQVGDAVLLSGTLGDHGIAVLAARGELDFEAQVVSDVAPLTELVEAMHAVGADLHVLRDPTRGGLATTLNEIAHQSQVGIEIDETSLPVNPAVEAACEMLGFDPLYVANEGKLVAIAPEAQAEALLKAMRATKLGHAACRIGRVTPKPAGRVLMRTGIGARRVVDVLSGELLPRIC